MTSSSELNKPTKQLRVVLITQGISRVVFPVLQQRDVQVVGIVESAQRGFEAGAEIRHSFRKVASVIKQRIRPMPSLINLAEQRSIPYFLLHKANKQLFADWLQNLQTDLIVIYSMSQLLSPQILAIPRLGVLNLHPALLPAYRGANPSFWMYYNLEKQGGVTLHFLDAGEDTGDIVYQRTYDIPLGMKSPDMQDLAIGKHGVEMMLNAMKILAQGHDLPRTPQPAQSPTAKARNVKPAEHRTMIDWQTWPIERIWHVMSGTELWLNCIDQPCGVHAGQRWVVQGFERSVQQIDSTQVGKVEKDAIGNFVRCRDGIIRLNARFNLFGFARYFFTRITK